MCLPFKPVNPISRNLPWRYAFNIIKIHKSRVIAGLIVILKHWKLPKDLYLGDWIIMAHPHSHNGGLWSYTKKYEGALYKPMWVISRMCTCTIGQWKKVQRISIVCSPWCKKEGWVRKHTCTCSLGKRNTGRIYQNPNRLVTGNEWKWGRNQWGEWDHGSGTRKK